LTDDEERETVAAIREAMKKARGYAGYFGWAAFAFITQYVVRSIGLRTAAPSRRTQFLVLRTRYTAEAGIPPMLGNPVAGFCDSCSGWEDCGARRRVVDYVIVTVVPGASYAVRSTQNFVPSTALKNCIKRILYEGRPCRAADPAQPGQNNSANNPSPPYMPISRVSSSG